MHSFISVALRRLSCLLFSWYPPLSSPICPHYCCCHQNLSISGPMCSNASRLLSLFYLVFILISLLIRFKSTVVSCSGPLVLGKLMWCGWQGAVAFPLAFFLFVFAALLVWPLRPNNLLGLYWKRALRKVFHLICCGAGDFAGLALLVLLEAHERGMFAWW